MDGRYLGKPAEKVWTPAEVRTVAGLAKSILGGSCTHRCEFRKMYGNLLCSGAVLSSEDSSKQNPVWAPWSMSVDGGRKWGTDTEANRNRP